MSAAEFQRVWHLAVHQTRGVMLWWSPVVLQLFSRVPSSVRSNWLLPCAEWQEQLEVLSQCDSAPTPYCELAIHWSLSGFMYYILTFGLVCLLLAFWECVINGAQWAVNVRQNVNFGSSQTYVVVWDTKQISSHATFCFSCDEECFVIKFHWYQQLCRQCSNSVSYSIQKFYQQMGLDLATLLFRLWTRQTHTLVHVHKDTILQQAVCL